MQIIERGTGTPLVLVPPLPGRWEYVRPAVNALAESFRVITFSLCDEPSSAAPFAASSKIAPPGAPSVSVGTDGATSLTAGRLGKIEIRGSEIILGPPLKFTKENIDRFNF